MKKCEDLYLYIKDGFIKELDADIQSKLVLDSVNSLFIDKVFFISAR